MKRYSSLSRLLFLVIMAVLLAGLVQPVFAQGGPPTDKEPSITPLPSTITSMQKMLDQVRPQPSTPEEWAEYNALLELRNSIQSGDEIKYREAQARKMQMLPALYSPEYIEARKRIGKAITEMLQSGQYSLDEIANMDIQQIKQATGRELPVISVSLNIRQEPKINSNRGVMPTGMDKGRARRGDIILVHNKRIWKPAWYGYWTHTIMVRGYDNYIHAPGLGRPVQRATWRDDIARRTAAIMGVWTWSSMRHSATSYAEGQWGEPYNWWSPKWSDRDWYCSKLPWAGYFYKSWGIIDIDGTARWPGWWWWYWVTPDDIWLSWWTYIRDISISA
ncbi:hypothetical protein D6833_09560 [Candidatus Parcubacteria bacterium]|nr:MAG: hypothetical protein D6833_09560 [Candidatus Parcubacteria bacterium]